MARTESGRRGSEAERAARADRRARYALAADCEDPGWEAEKRAIDAESQDQRGDGDSD